MSEPLLQSFTTTLMDADTGHDGRLSIRLVGSPHGIGVYPEGHGDHTSDEGQGTPVFLELFRGELRVIIWGDINREEPTHIIPLSAAREDRRDLCLV